MPVSYRPFEIVALSTGTYSLVLYSLRKLNASSPLSEGLIKAISSGHATVTSILALYAFHSSQWHPSLIPTSYSPAKSPKYTSGGHLDDSANPFIQGRSTLANDLTAWEAGYLIYDTYALIGLPIVSSSSKFNVAGAVSQFARSSPAVLVHHILLGTGLLYLQLYIAQGYERGVRVIVALMLMNASSPLMHARWWARKSGMDIRVLDFTLALVFALSRFGTVAWVLRRYGRYHGLGPWDAYKRLRLQCRTGTAALIGFNGLWWAILIKGIIKKGLQKRTSS